MGILWQDVRYGLRMLGRRPALSVIAILTLALGIGANASIFSLVNSVLLRPLPFAHPDRLVMLHERSRGSEQQNISAHEFVAWRDGNHTLERIALYAYGTFNLTGSSEPESLNALVVSSDFFSAMGHAPRLGRALGRGDDQPGAHAVVVLSDALWRRRYGADPAVVGRTIHLDNQPHTVVGVMAPKGNFDPDLWTPMDLASEVERVGKHSNVVVARLKANVTIEAAQSDLAAISRRLEQELPDFNTGHGVRVVSMHEQVVGAARRPLLVFLGAVAFILLIACANVAHLLLTRAAARQRELGVRTALGASRTRLIRQLLTESVLLALAGGFAGLLLAAWVVDLLPSVVQLPRIDELTIDGRVLAVGFGLSLLTGIVSGLVPALQSSRLRNRMREWMADGSRVTMGPGQRLASVLIVSEVAIALVLLVAAGLTMKSFTRLIRVDPGFDAQQVALASLALPPTRYPEPQQRVAAFDELSARLRAIPGVSVVGATSQIPVGPCCNTIAITIEGRTAPAPNQEPRALMSVIADDYFRTMQIPLRSGRTFSSTDARRAVPLIRWYEQQPNPAHFEEPQPAPVAIINEAMAARYWPGENALGKRFRILFSPWVTVVGVAGNVRQRSLGIASDPEMYVPMSQEPQGMMHVVARTTGDPRAVIRAVREQVRAFNRDLPGEIVPLEEMLRDSVRAPRFNALLLALAGGLALLLALIGIYGVISYSVERRTHEIGIRSALGADTTAVLKLVLGRALLLAGVGIVIGLAGALALSRFLQRMLFEVEPTDPMTFATIAVLLAAVSLLASYLPTRRAMRIDPLTALRSE
jgi:putative ABC transport system permease protein